MNRVRRSVFCPASLMLVHTGLLWFGPGCTPPAHVRTIDAYRAAKKRGDLATAAAYLADDARVWFDKKEGPGEPLRPKGGPYAQWDAEFRSTSTRDEIRVRGNTVSYVVSEINDFYRLIDGVAGKYRMTYYFADDGKIAGRLIQGVSPKSVRPPDRRCEFERWAAKKVPGLLEAEEMKIPNQPRRGRSLLTEWRAEIGLSPIE